MTRTLFNQAYAQLPNSLPVFPLSNAVLMPGSYLPLNIFEPRYLNMVHDAMRGDQLIGMIQPATQSAKPELHRVGCCGRIVRYEEIEQERFKIMLLGLCRFEVKEELDALSDYRIVATDWVNYQQDMMQAQPKDSAAFDDFRVNLKAYLDKLNADPQWKEVVDSLPAEQLVNNSVCYLSLDDSDKQMLLEIVDLDDRIQAFSAILRQQQSSTSPH